MENARVDLETGKYFDKSKKELKNEEDADMNEILNEPTVNTQEAQTQVPRDLDMTEVNTDGWLNADSEVKMDLNSDSPFAVVNYNPHEELLTKEMLEEK